MLDSLHRSYDRFVAGCRRRRRPRKPRSDAAGTWDVTFNTQNGPMPASMTIKKDGEKLAGTMTGPQGDVAVKGRRRTRAVALSLSVQTPNGAVRHRHERHAQDGDAHQRDRGLRRPQASRNGPASARRRSGSRRRRGAAVAAATGEKPVDVTGAWAFTIETGDGTGDARR